MLKSNQIEKLIHCFYILPKGIAIKNPKKQEKQYLKQIFATNCKNVKFPINSTFINEAISKGLNDGVDYNFLYSYEFAAYLLEVELPTLKNVNEFISNYSFTSEQKEKLSKNIEFCEKLYKQDAKKHRYEFTIGMLNKALHFNDDFHEA